MGLEEGHETEKTFAQFDTDLFYLGLVLFPIMIVNIVAFGSLPTLRR